MKIKHTVDATKLKSLFSKIDSLAREGDKASANAVAQSVLKIHEIAVKSIQANSDGPKQIRYKPKRTVHVSPPGTPPNTDTGRLVQSIEFQTSEKGLVGRVGTNLKYGKDLEFGTKKMDARPWLQPAVQQAEKDMPGFFVAELKTAIKGVKK